MPGQSTATVSLTTAFVDLSTYDEIECFLYGGRSVNKFRKVIRKSSWFTVIAAQLNRIGTQGDFGQEVQAMFSRAGDYIRDVWLRVQLPEVRTRPGFQARWTRNIGHNLIEEAWLLFNDLTVNRLNSYHMDFLHAFMTPAGKVNGYENMIGNINPLVNPYEYYRTTQAIVAPTPEDLTANPPVAYDPGNTVALPAAVLNIPLPFYFTNDPSDAIIQAACPFNDVRLTIKFRNWEQLLLVDQIVKTNPTAGEPTTIPHRVRINNPEEALVSPSSMKLLDCQIWAHYAVVPNGDREKISEECDIDSVISQVQHIPATNFAPATQSSRGIDLRFAHSIRAIFFAMRNTTVKEEWSNYTTHTTRGVGDDNQDNHGIIMQPVGSTTPIASAVLTYENVDRVNMNSDYFSLVAPYYSANRIPDVSGYHLLSYANRLDSLQPDGSTNFARLASVNLNITASDVAIAQSGDANTTVAKWDPRYHSTPATFDIIITASSITILRASGGSMGFPVL